MSCNSHRRKFLQQICQGEPSVVNRLGSGDPTIAATVLEQVYQRTIPSRADARAVAPKTALSTTALFLEFQQRGIPVPTHTQLKEDQPVPLPSDPQTLCKYAAVYNALQACRKVLPLSPLAERLVKVYSVAPVAWAKPTRLHKQAMVAKAAPPNNISDAPTLTLTPPTRPAHWQPFQTGEKPAYARSSTMQPSNEVFNEVVISCPDELLVVRPSQRSRADTEGGLVSLEEHSFEVSRYNQRGNLSSLAHTEGDVWKLMLENPGKYIEEHRGDEDFVHHSYFDHQDNLWHFTRTGTQQSYDVTMSAEERDYFSQELDRFPSGITSWQETAYYDENDTGDSPGLLVREDNPKLGTELDEDEAAEDYYYENDEEAEELATEGSQDNLGWVETDKANPRKPFDQGGFNRLYSGFIISTGPTYTADLTTFNLGSSSRSKLTNEQALAQARRMEGIVRENAEIATEWSTGTDLNLDLAQLEMRDLMTKLEHYDHRQLQGSLHTTLGEIAEVNSEFHRLIQAQLGAKEQAQALNATTFSKPTGTLNYAFAGANYCHEIKWDEAGVHLKERRIKATSSISASNRATSSSQSKDNEVNSTPSSPSTHTVADEQILIDWPTWDILAKRVQAVEARLRTEAQNQTLLG